MPSTVTPLEAAWTLVAALGTLAALWVVLDAFQDLRAARGGGSGLLGLIARVNLVSAVGISYVLTVFAGIGLRAMTLPTNTTSGEPDLGTVVVGLSFVVAGAVLAAIPLLGAWARRRIRAMAERAIWDGRTERRNP